MLPLFLAPDGVVRQDGTGPVVDLGADRGKNLLVSFAITRIIEQESIDVSIWGSTDGQNWGDKPLLAFPQKFYCGNYCLMLELSDRREIRYLRAQWKLNRWGRGEATPLFGFYVFLQEALAAVAVV